VCAVLLPPGDCLELALRKTGESELSNKKGEYTVKNTYEGGYKDALSTRSIGAGNRSPQLAQFLWKNFENSLLTGFYALVVTGDPP
jgi:hypothetical protein